MHQLLLLPLLHPAAALAHLVLLLQPRRVQQLQPLLLLPLDPASAAGLAVALGWGSRALHLPAAAAAAVSHLLLLLLCGLLRLHRQH
jgi:hypothetical protein